MKYDPRYAPDPEAWLAAPESVRLEAVLQYHLPEKSKIESVRTHASIHTAVENQIAMGDELPTRDTIARLMRQGLDRHEAIHAVGSIVAGQIYRLLNGGETPEKVNADYAAQLERLTPEFWRKEFS